MQLLYIVVVGVLSLGARGDDCSPKPGEKFPPPSECCKKDEKLPEVFKENIPKCRSKFPIPGKKGEFTIANVPPEVRNAMACTAECVFEESGLLTSDKKIDVAAVKKLFISTYPENKDISSNVDKCYSLLSSQMDKTLDCKSGVFEFENCLRHNCFLHCPKDKWVSSKECEDLKKKVETCPTFPMVSMMEK